MRAIALLLTLTVGGWAQAARAQADTGLTLGARVGYGIPLGDVAKADAETPSLALSKVVSGQIPLEIEAGWRFTREISAGLYFGYGFAFAGRFICDQAGIPPEFSCSTSGASTMRYGIQAAYRFVSGGAMTPWIGLGAGLEQAQMDVKVSFQGQSAKQTFKISGWEYANLQLGADWVVSPGLKLGPFARVSLGKFDTVKLAGEKQDFPSSIQALHEWVTLGLKGTFDL